jgi:integrase/recombinase XerD
VDRLTPHGLRATAITLYLDATNGDVRGAQQFAGHARPETTMGYDRRRKTYSGHGAYVLATRFGTLAGPGTDPADQQRPQPGRTTSTDEASLN